MGNPRVEVRSIQRSATPELCSWMLTGALVALNGTRSIPADLDIHGGQILAIHPKFSVRKTSQVPRFTQPWPVIDLSGYLLLPGLINAHDHLEFNLFPRLGRGPYRNSEEWARDVYQPGQSPVREHLSIPKPIRLWWGALKNLFSGVTTVCHHNPPIRHSLAKRFPVRVVERYAWAHSLAFGANIRQAFRTARCSRPFVIHLGEGTDERSRDEIFRLDRIGALDQRTTIVHGVGLDEAGHSLLEQRGAGMIWCPTSNMFSLGKTLGPEQITRHSKVALGSDSALTAKGDLLDEIHFARQTTRLSAEFIYTLVNDSAARLLRLNRGEGAIRQGGIADVIAVADNGNRPCDRLAHLKASDIELVMVGGKVKLLSAKAAGRWPHSIFKTMEVLQVGNTERLVASPVGELFKRASEPFRGKLYLAGRKITR